MSNTPIEHQNMEACSCGHDHGHHHHEETCSCGHDHGHHHHEEACSCGHDHGHHHHEETCSCGHDHGHHHHEETCSCGHDHGHHHHEVTGGEKRVYLLENLGCANCAAKMEQRIATLPGITAATITFATKQLRITAADPDALFPQIRDICTSIEPEVWVIPRDAVPFVSGKTKIYLIENLGCANCAAKMEQRIAALPGVTAATITFATRQLRITAADPDALLPQIRDICTSIESEVQVVERESIHDHASSHAETTSAGKEKPSGDRRELAELIIGGVLFLLGLLLQYEGFNSAAVLGIFVIGYLILGGRILLQAARNISRGQIFDENFLMSLATLGAFAIREYPEALGVMLFYRVGTFFEHRAVDRSRSQIMDAVDMRPEVVSRLVDGVVETIPAGQARVGDLLLIRPGDRIPLDGIVDEGTSRLDTSPITGEPVPVAVAPGDPVTSGCVNLSGQLKLRVEKPLEESMVTRILDSVENAAASKPRIDRFITRFARIYTPFVVLAAVATAIIPSLVTGDWNYWIYTALSFLVISCPCALVLSVPLAFFSGIGAGSKQGILFKGGVSIEALGRLKAVVMDKTGTVTQGNFKVQRIVPTGPWAEDELLRICAGCEQNSTHPIAHSIVSAARERGIPLTAPLSMEEIAGEGVAARMSEGEVLCGNQKLMDRHGISTDMIHSEAYGAEVYLAIGGKLAGYFLISDTIKADAKSAIARLKAMGLHTAMLTGDSENSARAVAAETVIQEVHAKLLPQDKLSALAKIRNDHGAVMFVGDGINDAPVLAGADVGAAMGSGADAAIEAADAVFMTSSVESIPQAIAIARSTNRIAVQNVVFALVIKVIVMILGLCGHANMWMAVFADTGVAMLCVLNSIRILYKK